MDCKELGEPDLLTIIFRENNERQINRIFKCFYQKYYDKFMYMSHKISAKYPFLKGNIEFYGSQAFNDALLAFYDRIAKTGFKDNTAKIETYFFAFCINKFHAITTKERRMVKKDSELGPILHNNLSISIEAEDIYSEQEALFQNAMDMMDEKRGQYIVLRKIYKLNDKEIAEIMGVNSDNVKNEVYRSFLKLKENVTNLKTQKVRVMQS